MRPKSQYTTEIGPFLLQTRGITQNSLDHAKNRNIQSRSPATFSGKVEINFEIATHLRRFVPVWCDPPRRQQGGVPTWASPTTQQLKAPIERRTGVPPVMIAGTAVLHSCPRTPKVECVIRQCSSPIATMLYGDFGGVVLVYSGGCCRLGTKPPALLVRIHQALPFRRHLLVSAAQWQTDALSGLSGSSVLHAFSGAFLDYGVQVWL